MALPLSSFLVAAVAVFLTGLSKSGFGGGLGVVSVPLMCLFVEPQFAVAILIPVLIAMDVIIAWQYRHRWNREVVLTMLPGALVGLAVGAATFRWMDANLIRLAVGILAAVFVGQYLFSRNAHSGRGKNCKATPFALGTLSGFTSFVAHAGGPPVKGYLLRQGLAKSEFVGTNTMYFFALNALKTVSYTVMGQLSADSLKVSLILSPVLVIGIGLGMMLHRHIDQSRFTAIVYLFLSVAGAKLIFDSVSSFLT